MKPSLAHFVHGEVSSYATPYVKHGLNLTLFLLSVLDPSVAFPIHRAYRPRHNATLARSYISMGPQQHSKGSPQEASIRYKEPTNRSLACFTGLTSPSQSPYPFLASFFSIMATIPGFHSHQ